MSSLDRLKNLENKLAQTQSYIQALHHKLTEVEANNNHLGKLVLAISESLVKNNLVKDSELFVKISELEDDQVRDQINQMLKLNAIVRVEEASEKCVLILRQVKDSEVISNYFLAPYRNLPPEVAEQVVGAKEGFKFTHGTVECEILEIYNQAE